MLRRFFIQFLYMDKSIKKILQILEKNYPKTDLELVKFAYDFAEKTHKGEKRLSGEPQINHCLATALYLAQWKLPANIVIAGLLHDIPEYTPYTLLDIEKIFGKEVSKMVEGEIRLDNLKYRGKIRYAENLRRMFLSVAKDVRVIFIKFAERIDNLQTLDVLPVEKKRRLAVESLEIYSTIATRLGMDKIRRLLEDPSFKCLQPKEYKWVNNLTKSKHIAHGLKFNRIKKIISKDLQKANIKVIDIHSRTKGIYSLYKKLLRYNKNIDDIYDVFASRIIVDDVINCYTTLGIIHNRWKPLKSRIKDYIAQPKPNGYQSLHTSVFYNGKVIEFQIRTQKMHEESEFGLASHWFYKERGEKSLFIDKHTVWLKELVKIQKKIKGKEKFLKIMDEFKIDIFHNRIFVFTPQGDVIDLPEKATPVDFAYSIHTNIGNKCVKAKVNNKLVPLDHKLFSGDLVEIIIDEKQKKPNPKWLKFVKTHQARTKIKEQL